MTATTAAVRDERAGLSDTVLGVLRRNAWALTLLAFFALMLAFTRMIQPTYGASGIQGLAIGVLPLAFAAAAQAVIVISGGIDLSIGGMMALTSVVAASNMDGQSEEVAVVIVIIALGLGILLGAINGTLIVLTKVPDIIVTLAMSFVWAGCALLVLRTPGGDAAEWLTNLVLGSVGSEWLPKATLVLVVLIALIWIPLQRSRFGLWLYAVGSSQLSAFRSGVPVARAKILAYAVGGLLAALGGLSLTAATGNGTPVAGSEYVLLSVAAVVLGGVSLAGGRGGLFGPIVAVFILTLLKTDLSFLKINSNLATVAQGVVLIVVVMVGTLLQYRRSRS